MSSPTQEEIDRMLGLTAKDWSALRSGQIPARLGRLAGGGGLLRPFAIFFGAGVGALAGYTTGSGPGRSMVGSVTTWVVLCAVVGAVVLGTMMQNAIGAWLERLGRDLQRAVVLNEVLRVRLERENRQTLLRAEDGRDFRLIPIGGQVALEGMFRVYYVDLGAVTTGRLGVPEGAYFVVGLEKVD